MFKEILRTLDKGSLEMINLETSKLISDTAVSLLNTADKEITKVDLEKMLDILKISNILYNNTNRAMLPLEDGVYDLLVVKYDSITGNKAPVGAKPIYFNEETQDTLAQEAHGLSEVVRRVDKSNMLFFDAITNNSAPIREDFIIGKDDTLIEKKNNNTAHNYPELVGTLHKCKFTTIPEALSAGVDLDDSSIKIFERDFLMKFGRVMPPELSRELILELKYDGVSVEAEVQGDKIISAVSRGDTANDEASDLTPILGGYTFHRATGFVPTDRVFGIKFEAIITFSKLEQLKEMYGKSYVNARTAIIGLTSSLDSRMFKDFITLVPIASSGLGIEERQVDIEFLNKYYSSGVDLRYQIISGNEDELLYQTYKFVREAEYMRPFINFMYDGVVVSFTHPQARQMLGRVNSINLWSMAIKFNAFKKQTIFRQYTFTVGQDGRITPMAWFDAVEFLGTIHNHTTVHSLKRFNTLALRHGDVVDTEYRHDVIVYISKPENSYNAKNSNPIIEFPRVCPSCGAEITVSDSGDSAFCTNFNCPERVIGRMTNMLKKVNIKDFAESSIKALGVTSLTELLSVDLATAEAALNSKVNAAKLMDRINQIKTTPIKDYRIVGALGFTSVMAEKWKLVLKNIHVETIVTCDAESLYNMILAIKGLGPETARTICTEREAFAQDLATICNMDNVERTYGDVSEAVQIRFTGCRDEKLEEELIKLGFDASGNKSVTKKTAFLIVPYSGFTSTKLNKISSACNVITLEEAWAMLSK